jgi:hypothetical protein
MKIKMIDFNLSDPKKLKASEIFLIFSKPYFDFIPNHLSLEDYKKNCQFCEAIWNIININQWPSTTEKYSLSEFMQNIKKEFSNHRELIKVVKQMIRIKEQLFSDAIWAFEITVRKEIGQYPFIIRAAIRMPDELIPKVPKKWNHLVNTKMLC